jgi:hypothetical protein
MQEAVSSALRLNVEQLCAQLDELENKQEALLASIGAHREFLSESDLVAQAIGEPTTTTTTISSSSNSTSSSRGGDAEDRAAARRSRSSLAAVRATMRKLPAYRAKCVRAKATMGACEQQLERLQLRVEKLRIAATASAAAAGDGGGPPALPPMREMGNFAYRVVYRGGVAVRSAPALDAPTTGEVLSYGDVFWAEERQCPAGSDGRTIFVRLPAAPGRTVVAADPPSSAGGAGGGGDGAGGVPMSRGWVFEAKPPTPQTKNERQAILERVSPREAQRLLGEDASPQPSPDLLGMPPPPPGSAGDLMYADAAFEMPPPAVGAEYQLHHQLQQQQQQQHEEQLWLQQQQEQQQQHMGMGDVGVGYDREEPLDSDLYDAL